MATPVTATQLTPDNAHTVVDHDPEQLGRRLSKAPSMAKDTVFEKSPGVLKIEAISSVFTHWYLWVLFLFVFLISYCYGLDGTMRYTLQNYALASFDSLAQISTVTVVRSIVAAAGQPVYAKISDFFGRASILFIAVFFYVIGTIVQAASKSVATFSGGAVLYQLGYTGLQLLVEVIIGDSTSLRNRLFFSFIPAAPFLINAWVSGNIVDALYKGAGWEWGIGMWAIIVPVLSLPLFAILMMAKRRAKKDGLLEGIPKQNLLSVSLWLDFANKVDLIGLFLLAATLSLCLLPFTLAAGTASKWRTAPIIVTLVFGFAVALPLFIVWEVKFAHHPILPFRLLRDRTILCGLGIALMLNTCWYTQGDYLYTTLIVAFDKSIIQATRVTNIYSFVSVVIGFTLGAVVRYVRRLKWFIVTGGSLFILAFGLLIRFRGGTSPSDFAGLIGAEVVLGIAGGMLSYPTQALVQAAVKHERMAVITALYLATYSVGSALGNTIAAAIWTNSLPHHLITNLNAAGFTNATELAAAAYGNPFVFVVDYPIGTPERTAVDSAFYEVQRYLCIAGICLSVILFALTFGLRDVRLTDEQSFEDAEEHTLTEKDREAIRAAESNLVVK